MLLLVILFLLILSPVGNSAFAFDEMGSFLCGIYVVKGKLLREESGAVSLSLLPDTRSHIEVPVYGLSLREKSRFATKYVELKVRVFEEGSGMEAAMESIGCPKPITEEEALIGAQNFIKKERCKEESDLAL